MGYIGEDEELTERVLFPQDEPGTVPEQVPQTKEPVKVPEVVPA